MNHEKIKARLYVILFMIILIVPTLSFPFAKDILNNENLEQRTLAKKPSIVEDGFEHFPEKFDLYWNDNLPYRNQLIRFNNSIDYYVLHSSPNKNVTIGKNGWLFYSDDEDYNPVIQSLGKWHVDNAFLEQAKENLVSSERVLASLGIEFVIFLAPNKETIYIDQLPIYYRVSDEYTSIDQFVDYMRENTDIRIVYPKEDLLAFRAEYPDIDLYNKHDTHWNHAGGYIGARALLAELEIDLPLLQEITCNEVPSKTNDLAGMMNVHIPKGNLDYEISGYSELKSIADTTDFESYFTYHTVGGDPRRLVVRRDSYCTAMADYISSQFEYSNMIFSSTISNQKVMDEKPDIYVYETVERYFRGIAWMRISYVDVKSESENGQKNIYLNHAIKTDKEPVITVYKESGDEKICLIENGLIPDDVIISVPESEEGHIIVEVNLPEWDSEPVETRVFEY